jgi:hypothetical protein
MSDILNQLDQIGGWTGPKEWTQDPIAAAAKEEIKRLRALVEYARNCLLAIKDQTLKGAVCDDVAWFDDIETLHDYCLSAADRLSHTSTMLGPVEGDRG